MRINTGIPELDKKIGGGFPEKSVNLVSGGIGTGKTLFGLNFVISGAERGEKCVYVSLNENREELLRACATIASLRPAEKLIQKNLALEYVVLSKTLDLDFFTKIFRAYPQVDRVVIDNVTKLLLFSENKHDYRIHLAELVRYLKERVGCSLLLCETQDDTIDSGNGEAYETDSALNLSFLTAEEKPRRILRIYKMRYTAIEPLVPYEFTITSDGLRLGKSRTV
jgi:circadian clock protein KaiC